MGQFIFKTFNLLSGALLLGCKWRQNRGLSEGSVRLVGWHAALGRHIFTGQRCTAPASFS
ncbi:hypothetical protein ACRRTK_012124 [Alexandromys fortis]